MLQLKNNTPFAANMALFPNQDGIDTLYLIVKAGFNIGPKSTLIDEQQAPLEADVFWGEPDKTSLKYASDFHVGKPGTDIAMIGQACAPGKKTVSKLDVSLSVGRVNKTVRVFGDRQWLDGAATRPESFQTMPMVYEKSFGGMHLVDGKIDSIEARNPLGCGYAGSRSVTEMNAVPLPNLEDPQNLITEFSATPAPAGFGFCAPSWRPRVAFAGTYDEAWQSNRAPYLPEDFDSRFLNMAHPDLICADYLRGGEAVSITGMHPGGALNFSLPRIELHSRIKLGSQLDHANFYLETLLFEPNQLQLSLVWKAAYCCDKNALKIEEIKIGVKH
jgi:hypothetical protein